MCTAVAWCRAIDFFASIFLFPSLSLHLNLLLFVNDSFACCVLWLFRLSAFNVVSCHRKLLFTPFNPQYRWVIRSHTVTACVAIHLIGYFHLMPTNNRSLFYYLFSWFGHFPNFDWIECACRRLLKPISFPKIHKSPWHVRHRMLTLNSGLLWI